jgi:chromosome segregation ATPase
MTEMTARYIEDLERQVAELKEDNAAGNEECAKLERTIKAMGGATRQDLETIEQLEADADAMKVRMDKVAAELSISTNTAEMATELNEQLRGKTEPNIV